VHLNADGFAFLVISVPSLSNVAMRSSTGTKSGEPAFVTFSTKAMMAFSGAVSFPGGSGSAARETAVVKVTAPTSAAAPRIWLRMVFMAVIS
jgi:hypothetical protein